MDKYTWHAEPHMTEIDICRNENSGNEIIFVVERIDEAKQACKELNDLQHHLTQAYEVVTAQATRIQELEAERNAYSVACIGMTPDGLHAWINRVSGDYARLRQAISAHIGENMIDIALEKIAVLESDKQEIHEHYNALRRQTALRIAELEALLLESESADTTADDVNATPRGDGGAK